MKKQPHCWMLNEVRITEYELVKQQDSMQNIAKHWHENNGSLDDDMVIGWRPILENE